MSKSSTTSRLKEISGQLKETTVKDFGSVYDAACDFGVDDIADRARLVTEALSECHRSHLIPPSTPAFDVLFRYYYVDWKIFNIVKQQIAKTVLADWDSIYAALVEEGFQQHEKDEGKLQNAVLVMLDRSHNDVGIACMDVKALLEHNFSTDTTPMECLLDTLRQYKGKYTNSVEFDE